MKRGYDSLEERPLSINLMIEICRILRDSEIDIRKVPGTIIANQSTAETLYTPPAGEKVILEKLSNLEQYIHAEDDLDPLVRLAVMHYQFEAIHPFQTATAEPAGFSTFFT